MYTVPAYVIGQVHQFEGIMPVQGVSVSPLVNEGDYRSCKDCRCRCSLLIHQLPSDSILD